MEFKFIYRLVLVFVLGAVAIKCHCSYDKYVEDHVIPDVIPQYPIGELKIKFGNHSVNCASEIHRNLTDYQPKLDYLAKRTAFHTLAMVDPDAPEPQRPVFAQYVHWVVMNIPGVKVDDGKTLASYMPPSPPQYSSTHRYVLLIYQQLFYIFAPVSLGTKGRTNFNVTRFAESLELGVPTAGNYFFVKHDLSAT